MRDPMWYADSNRGSSRSRHKIGLLNTTEVWDDAGMRLDEISKNDADILRKIIALAQQLSLPLTSFTQALGQIREQEFGIPGRSRHRQAKAELRR